MRLCMTQVYANFLNETLLTQNKSIESYSINNQKVWLKKASTRHSAWIYWPLAWFSHLFGLSMLRPVPNYGGEKTIACEVSRIQQLSSMGISVPTILAYSKQGLLLKDAAENGMPVYQLQAALSQEKDISTRLSLYKKAISKIQHIHDLNGYLSEAFARNILVDKNHHFSFIDFETNPADVLTLPECHTRDWLCFIFSTASCFEEQYLAEISEYYVQHLKNHPDVYHGICKVGRILHWILKFNPEKFGSDGRRLKNCVLLLSLLAQKKAV